MNKPELITIIFDTQRDFAACSLNSSLKILNFKHLTKIIEYDSLTKLPRRR